MTTAIIDEGRTAAGYSGFGSRKEQELYDNIAFNSMRLLSMRTAKHLAEVQPGNYNPYSKQEAQEDEKLKRAMEKFYSKMVKMEKRKYHGPYLSEALVETATVIGCVKSKAANDALSATHGSSSDDDDADKQSLFSKFTSSKRPVGFFSSGNAAAQQKTHSGEVTIDMNASVVPVETSTKVLNEKHMPKRRQDQTMKSDQKGEESPKRSSMRHSPSPHSPLTEANIAKFETQHKKPKKQAPFEPRKQNQQLGVIHEGVQDRESLMSNYQESPLQSRLVSQQKAATGHHSKTYDKSTLQEMTKLYQQSPATLQTQEFPQVGVKQGIVANGATSGFAKVNQVQRQLRQTQQQHGYQENESDLSQSQPFIILQRSPNVVNHFSLAPSNSSQISNHPGEVSNQKDGRKSSKLVNKLNGKRNSINNKNTIDQLPSIVHHPDIQPVEPQKFRRNLHERSATIGGKSDQKDSMSIPQPNNISEGLSMINMRQQLQDIHSQLNAAVSSPQGYQNMGKRGRSTVERNESIGMNTIYRQKDAQMSLLIGGQENMIKTSPHSIQALQQPRDTLSDLNVGFNKQDSALVTLINNGADVHNKSEHMNSRNLYSQPPAFSFPLHDQQRSTYQQLDADPKAQLGRRTMVKNAYASSNKGGSQLSGNSPTGISNFSISNNNASRITKPAEVTRTRANNNNQGQSDNK